MLSFFLIIDLYFLIAAAIAENFNSTAELVIPIGIPTKDEQAEIERQPVIAEAKIRKFSIKFRVAQRFLCLLLINSFWSISLTKHFFVSYIFFNQNS